MLTATAAERESDSASPVAVVHVCGRDAVMLPPFVAIWRRTWPDAPLVLAEDVSDPLGARQRLGLPSVPCRWQGPRRARAVLDAMIEAAQIHPQAVWIVKTDCDTAHLAKHWLTAARPDSRMITLQNGRGWSDILGMAFAIERRLLIEIHAGEDCDRPGPETGPIHAAARRRALNQVWAWPHAPKTGGIFATLTDPAKASLYRSIYSVVHCGISPRSEAVEILSALVDSGY